MGARRLLVGVSGMLGPVLIPKTEIDTKIIKIKHWPIKFNYYVCGMLRPVLIPKTEIYKTINISIIFFATCVFANPTLQT